MRGTREPAAVAMLIVAAAAGSAAQAHPAHPSTKLVVLIAVDQMRADYLSRFASQWTGG